MGRTVEAACQAALARAGLPTRGALARLLGVLHAASETHLGLAEVTRLAARAGLPAAAEDLARHLATLVEHGLLARLPNAGGEPRYDTVPETHSHLLYEETGEMVDLAVSNETLLAIIRQMLADAPGKVDVLVRVRA